MPVLWLLAGGLLLYFLQNVIYIRYWSKGLRTGVSFTRKSAVEGESGELAEFVENNKILPLPAVKVKFRISRNLIFANSDESSVTDYYYRNDILSLGPNQRVTRKLPFVCSLRGYYEINQMNLVCSNLFLTREMMWELPMSDYMYVYPRAIGGQEMLSALRRLNGEIAVKRHMLEDPFEYIGIRPYAPYDEIKNMNWKATARMDEPMVNMRGYTSLQNVQIGLNMEDLGILSRRDMMELSIRIATAMMEDLMDQGMRVGICSNGKDILEDTPLVIQPDIGSGHQETILKGLARLDLEKKPVDFAELFAEQMPEDGSQTAVVLISMERSEKIKRLAQQLEDKKIAFLWYCPLLPDMEDLVEDQDSLHFVRLDGKRMLEEQE